MEANQRNTMIKIAKVFIDKNFPANKTFTRNDISSLLFVREKEFEAFKGELFIKTNKLYRILPAFYEKILEWKKLHNENKENIENAIVEYKKLFESIEKTYNYSAIFAQLIPLIKRLHWYLLPVYRDLMIHNRRVSPEENIEEYYNHFHSLQDLYKIIDAPADVWKTLKGDVNLNQECYFNVYTNRWGHEDIYKVKRIYNGWYVYHQSIGGFCSPDGKGLNEDSDGGFIANFDQDYVEYPDKFHYVIERLWNLADETEMSIQELQQKLSEVAKLISEVEKTVKRYTPDWY